MRMTVRSLSGFVSAVIVTTIFVFGVQTPSQGQAPKDRDVRVTNTASEPVLTAIVGTPTVNVGNLPVAPARTPFQETVFAQIPSGVNTTSALVFEVPAGKRLVVEQVSLFGMTLPGNKLVAGFFSLSPGGETVSYRIPLSDQGNITSTQHFVATQLTRFAVEAGHQLHAFSQRNNEPLPSSLVATVSGYLEDEP